jgi:ribosomal protein L29
MTMTAKHVREMSPEEAAATLKELRRGPKPEPMPVDRKAKDMSPAERAEFLREVNRRWG